MNPVPDCAYTTRGGPVAGVRFWEPVMKRRIIEVLTYPRIMLLADLDGRECPQRLFFNPANERCQICERGKECQWLNNNDKFSALARKSTASLYELLLFCIGYVDAQCAHINHNVRRCACESCHWVRSARRLELEFKYRQQTH